MKRTLLDWLICPACLPEEHPLRENTLEAQGEDLIEGVLTCGLCGRAYPVRDGIALLDRAREEPDPAGNRYEAPQVLSSYLWSHFGDLLRDDQVSDAYTRWAGLMQPTEGLCLDTGSAVGRFTFEMARTSGFAIGIDNSHAFVGASRELMKRRRMGFSLAVEGRLTREAVLCLPDSWRTDNLEFVVGDAQALPFRSGTFSALSSLNVVDKVPKPLIHLLEIHRTARASGARFLFSDPFSWSAEVADEADWLGGIETGPFAGRGEDNVAALLEGKTGHMDPKWEIEGRGSVWWKIRTHTNHYEWIRSRYVKAVR